MWKAANLRRERNVLVIDHMVPTWDQDAGSLRMREILRTLVELGCHVSFLPDNLVQAQPYTRELQRLGVEVLYGVDPRVALRAIGPTLSLAILSRPHVAARWLDVLREYAPDVMTVYDTVDLHWLREARQAAAALGTDELVLSPKALAIRELEHAMIRATDATVVVTETELARVSQDLPGTTLHVLPIGNHIRVTVLPVDARSGILFVGGFVHPPNVDAALLLAQEVMPLVWRELPGVKLTIAGAHPPPQLQQLSSRLIEVPGWVEDLDPLLGSSRALVAPLRYGAGLKGKVTQALAEGLPVVTTPIGAEGLDAVDGEQILIGSGVAELAAQTVTVLTDDSLWQRLSSAGQLLIADRGSPAVMSERLRELLDQCGDSGLRRITTPSWMRIHSIGNGSSMRSG
jgi:glycosyltransferase involved in cell wall biosynthesis